MMWILQALLFLLKLIGIILLVLLGLILTIVLIVLLVPIRYQVEGSYYENPNIKAKVTWLFSAVSVLFRLENSETDLKIRLFGFSLGQKKEEKQEKDSNKKKTEKKAPSSPVAPGKQNENNAIADESSMETTDSKVSDKHSEAEKETSVSPKENAAPDAEEPDLTEDDPKDSKEPKEKKKVELDNLKQKADFLKEQWEDPGNRALLKDILFRLKKILLHLIPTRFDLSLHFGLDNPGTMGQVLSILAILYPIYGENIHILPDFENQVVEGEGLIKGRIRLIVFVYAAIRILLNPQVRILIRRLKRQNGADHE